MHAPTDPLCDPLADAALSERQRAAWDEMRGELALARVRIQELEGRLRVMETRANAEGHALPAPTFLNKPDFNREVARMLAFDERYGTASSLLYFDIENLDGLRQRHGAGVAEAAIRVTCDTLAGQVRRSDVLGRLAPDEFGALLPRCNNENAWKKGELVAAQIHDALTALWGPNLKPVISYGAYTFQSKEDLPAGLKNAALHMTQLVRT